MSLPNSSKAAHLRRLLARPGQIVVAPGAYDAFTARLIEVSGFEAVYMTGAGVQLCDAGPAGPRVVDDERNGSAGGPNRGRYQPARHCRC